MERHWTIGIIRMGLQNSHLVCAAVSGHTSEPLLNGGGKSTRLGSHAVTPSHTRYSRFRRQTSSHSAHEGASRPFMG